MRELAEIILAKGLTSDIDSAIKIVFTQLKISPEKGDGHQLRIEDFNRIFLLSLLKHSFLEVLSQVEASASNRDIKLSLKIENFQRKNMFDGLRRQRDGTVNAEALLHKEKPKGKESSAKKGLEVPALINAPNGIKDGVAIMSQHVMNRDYKLSRGVID